MKYASLEDFDSIIKKLAHDTQPRVLNITNAQLLATLSLLLAHYSLADHPPHVDEMFQDILTFYADELIDRYPFAEGYVDYLFGAALLRRELH